MFYSEDGKHFVEVTDEQIRRWNEDAAKDESVSEVTHGDEVPYLCKGEAGLDLPGKDIYATTLAPKGWPFRGRSAWCAKYWKRQEKNRQQREKRAEAKKLKKRCECCGKFLDS